MPSLIIYNQSSVLLWPKPCNLYSDIINYPLGVSTRGLLLNIGMIFMYHFCGSLVQFFAGVGK